MNAEKLILAVKKIIKMLSLIRANATQPGNLGMLAQLTEMAKLRLLRGIGPNYYLLAGFGDENIPWELKLSHKSAAEYKRWVNEKNPKLYRKISQNKLVESAMLRFMDIPSTRFLGYLHHENGIDAEQRALASLSALSALLLKLNPTAVVLKPLEGHGGYGIRVCDIQTIENVVTLKDRISSDEIKLLENEPSAKALMQFDEGWIVEEYFEQHPILAEINPSSVNTIRMWVDKSVEGTTRCIAGYLRIGRSGAVVDNQSSGGIVCPIEHSSGKLRKTQSGTPERQTYAQHPDHGALIEGVELPFWSESQALAVRAMNAFPHMNFCGLDIAIGQNGPVIVELNPSPDKEGAAFMQIPFPD